MERISTLNKETFESSWHQVAEATSEAFNFNQEEKLRLMNNIIARHIVLIPFLSGSPSPERDACSSLSVYLLSIQPETKPFYRHIPADDTTPLQRLSNLTTYSGGNEDLQTAGIAILALNMILDYSRDREQDAREAKYNPLNTHIWEKDEIVGQLKKLIEPYEAIYRSWDSYEEVLEPVWDNSPENEGNFGKKAL